MLTLAYSQQQNREIAEMSKKLYPDVLNKNTVAAAQKPTTMKIGHRHDRCLAIEQYMEGVQGIIKRKLGGNIWDYLYKKDFKTETSSGIINFNKSKENKPHQLHFDTLALWRLSKNVFQLDPDIANMLLKTTIKSKGRSLPSFGLDKTPYWSVYIDTTIFTGNNEINGLLITSGSSFVKTTIFRQLQFFVYAFGRPDDKLWGIYKDNQKLIVALFDENLNVCNYKNISEQPDLCFILNVLLYINTYLQTIYNENNNSLPENPKPKRKGGKLRWQEASKNTVWKVGTEVGERIREYNRTHASGLHTSKSPHIRRAHWHTYLTGPRTNPVPILKWIPPIPIAMPREEIQVNDN